MSDNDPIVIAAEHVEDAIAAALDGVAHTIIGGTTTTDEWWTVLEKLALARVELNDAIRSAAREVAR